MRIERDLRQIRWMLALNITVSALTLLIAVSRL